MGLFSQFSNTLKKMNDGQNLPLWQKAAAGLAAGGLGALVGTPADLTLVRMQVSGGASRAWALPPHRLIQVFTADSFHSLWLMLAFTCAHGISLLPPTYIHGGQGVLGTLTISIAWGRLAEVGIGHV
jgi:hypothetical protein